MINVTKRDTVGIIELDRPQQRNALDVEHCHGLREAVDMVLRDRVRVVVITGAGSTFCSGADFGDLYDPGFREALYPALHAVEDAPVPVIAGVNGPAIGAGTQLAIACDLRVAAPGAVFGIPTGKIGLAVDPWTIQRLARLAGEGAARSILLAGADLSAEQAQACRLAELGSGDDVMSLAERIGGLAPLALSYTKRVLNHPDDPELPALFDACWTSDDLTEGQRARAEKRPAQFRGR